MSKMIEDIEGTLRRILAEPVEGRPAAERAARAGELLAELYGLADRVKELEAGEGVAPPAPESDLRGAPLHEAARRVLLEVGRPLHARELGRRIKSGGWRHPRSTRARDDQIVFQLAARLPRYPEVFRRVAPNTFGLVEWGDQVASAERPKPRPGLFRGPGKAISELIGESDAPFEEQSWRSS